MQSSSFSLPARRLYYDARAKPDEKTDGGHAVDGIQAHWVLATDGYLPGELLS